MLACPIRCIYALQTQRVRIPNFDVAAENRGSSSATALARAAFGADAAGAGANDFVAAADGTGDAHEDAAERYCYSVR